MDLKYRAAPGYVVREFMEEFLLIPVENIGAQEARLAILNPSGQFLWEQLQQERTLAELTTAMCGAFEVAEETAAADIREFLELLENNHCLVKMEE